MAEDDKSCHREILTSKVETLTPGKPAEAGLLRRLHRTRNRGKYAVRVRPDETNRADHQYQDDGEHNRVFCDILSTLIRAKVSQKLNHTASGPTNEFSGKHV
jgi:hypothetical protein